MIPPRIQDPLCPQCSPLSLPWLLGHSWSLLLDPSALPWSQHCQAEGFWNPDSTEKGQKPLCSRGQELGELQKSSHQEFPPWPRGAERPLLKFPRKKLRPSQPEGFSPPFPWQFHLHLCRKIRISPLPLARLEPSHLHFSSPTMETEKKNRVGHAQRRSWKKPRYHFSKVEDWWASLGLSTLE